MMDPDDIVPDRDELTPEVLRMQIEYTEEKKASLQERQEQERKLFELKKSITEVVEREVLQVAIDAPPAKRRKENSKVENNEEYMEQGESSSQVTEENSSAIAEISIQSNNEQHRREFEKLVAEYPFLPGVSKRSRKNIIKKLRIEFYRNLQPGQKKVKKKRKKSTSQVVREQGVTVRVPNITSHLTRLSESTNKTRVAIDCSYDNLMSEKAIYKVSKQMTCCYSLNRRMAQPMQLYFTHLKDKTLKRFDAAIAGYKNWDVFIKQETLAELYSVSDVVYLCTESENVIESLDDDKIYVIGGFVGHGPHDDIVMDQAKEAGFNTARLPIPEYFRLKKGYILSILDVFKIISSFSTVGGWKEAIKSSMPERKWLVGRHMNVDANEVEVEPRLMSESTNKIRIAIDCSFDSLMVENSGKVIRALCTQMQYCYSVNRIMAQPFQLYFTHFKDKTSKCFNDNFPLYKYWDVFIKQETLTELYSLSEVVYLCGESENVIETLDADKIYIIGGFVCDHESDEGIVLDRAKEAGFNTARLPIQEYFPLTKGNILSISDVFKIISSFSNLGGWEEAIKSSMPERKWLVERHMNVDVKEVEIKRRIMSKSTNKIRIAIDCSYDNLMSKDAVNRVSKQMICCYSLNRRMVQPMQLYFTHLKDKTLKRFDAVMDGYKSWDVFIKQETLAELYSVSEVVYLCAASDNVIETLDDDKIYVIGGFVGHGPHEDIVLDQAKEAGFNTARLPIPEYFRLKKGCILSISDVFKIISSFSTLGGWEEAIRSSMPKRKWLVD